MEEPQEVRDEEYERVWERVAAVDVAKASGVVCTRVPDEDRPGQAPHPGMDGDRDGERGRPSWPITCAAARSRSSRWSQRATTGASGTWCWRPPG